MSKRMMLKGVRKKKVIKLKYFIYVFIIYISFSYSFYNFIKNSNVISNEEFINMLVKSGNANILTNDRAISVVNKTMGYFFDIDFNNPSSILNGSILRYGNKSKDVDVISVEYSDDYSNMEELKDVSDYINDPNPSVIDKPIVYLYNSHQLENYSNNSLEIYGITPNVLMASYLIREKFNGMGIGCIVEDANMSEVLESYGWDYSYSYVVSRRFLEEKRKSYSSLKYFIDLHRDSVNHDMTTVNIDGKNYAKILFVVGMDHDRWRDNYKIIEGINSLFDKYYNGLSRGILTKTGPNVNGIYNQDVDSGVILIELGGVDNSIDEVNNTVNAIVDVFSKYIGG